MSGSLRTIPSILLTGILPFGAIFVELYFIMTSLWTNKIYYMFGFLFLCYGLMIITSAATTVLLVYFLLCAENYRWHWRAFMGAGMTGGYVFVNALIFWATRVSFGGLTGAVLYVGYSALIAFIVFILTGRFLFLCLPDGLSLLTFVQVPLVSLPVGHSSTVFMAQSRWTKGLPIAVSHILASHFGVFTREDFASVCFCPFISSSKRKSPHCLERSTLQIDKCVLIWRNESPRTRCIYAIMRLS
jgi:hypothetical protein